MPLSKKRQEQIAKYVANMNKTNSEKMDIKVSKQIDKEIQSM